MLSAKRIVEIFRRRGGGDFSNLTDKLSADEIAYLARMAGDEPIVAVMPSKDEWFALTTSQLIFSRNGELRRVRFDEIYAVAISSHYPENIRKFQYIKSTGGDLDVGLQDGTTLQVTVEPGGPYIGLMNVLMRIAAINHRRSVDKPSGHGALPTTNDRQPTTPL